VATLPKPALPPRWLREGGAADAPHGAGVRGPALRVALLPRIRPGWFTRAVRVLNLRRRTAHAVRRAAPQVAGHCRYSRSFWATAAAVVTVMVLAEFALLEARHPPKGPNNLHDRVARPFAPGSRASPRKGQSTRRVLPVSFVRTACRARAPPLTPSPFSMLFVLRDVTRVCGGPASGLFGSRSEAHLHFCYVDVTSPQRRHKDRGGAASEIRENCRTQGSMRAQP
jgi:hypothetical protein